MNECLVLRRHCSRKLLGLWPKKALETKIHALRLTEEEMTERIGDHQANLATKFRLEELQAAARKWADGH